MLKEKEIWDKLYNLPVMFRWHMSRKEYPRAKAGYDTARTVSVFLEIDEHGMQELFGERGERGAIISQGLFPEEQVQKAYLECIKANQTNECKPYPGIPKAV